MFVFIYIELPIDHIIISKFIMDLSYFITFLKYNIRDIIRFFYLDLFFMFNFVYVLRFWWSERERDIYRAV